MPELPSTAFTVWAREMNAARTKDTLNAKTGANVMATNRNKTLANVSSIDKHTSLVLYRLITSPKAPP